MTKSRKLASRLQELFIDGTWIANTNYQMITMDVSLSEAVKTLGPHHSIADLVYHIDYYLAGILEVFGGGTLSIKDQFSFDRPTLHSESDWQSMVTKLLSDAQCFIEHVSSMSDEELESDFVNPKYGSYERNIEGVIEHSYYHLGQISLVKKLVRNLGA